jgi:hypothetical protein
MCSSDRPTAPSNGPSIHLTLLFFATSFCNSSEATKNWTVSSSDGALVFTQCTNSFDHCTDACYLGIVGSSDDVFSFFFPFSFLTLFFFSFLSRF